MSRLLSLTAPLLISGLCLYALFSHVDVYQTLCSGAARGLLVMKDLLPALICLFPALWLFRETVLAELVTEVLRPVFMAAGVPPETGMLLILRPLSGAAAMGEAAALMEQYGANSLLGRTAAVMLGSSETSFYVIAVYFGAAGVKSSRWAIPAALMADAVCFLSSAWLCRLFWG